MPGSGAALEADGFAIPKIFASELASLLWFLECFDFF